MFLLSMKNTLYDKNENTLELKKEKKCSPNKTDIAVLLLVEIDLNLKLEMINKVTS